eukprot:scaffold6.g2618.t1
MRLQPRPLSSLSTLCTSLGCPVLDAFLGGGLPCGSITEISGEPSASKTQLCLQALLAVQLPRELGGLGGSAVYVYTEGEPAMRRLSELAASLRWRAEERAAAAGPAAAAALAGLPPDPTANVFVEKGVHSGAELLARLGRLRQLLAAQARGPRPVRLLVVDSVGHVFRELGDAPGAAELAWRTKLLFRLSALLRQYADEFNLAVLCVNQITDSVARDDEGRLVARAAGAASGSGAAAQPPAKNTGHTGGLRLVSLGREVVPALGLAWANCVNARVFLSRCALPGTSAPVCYHGPHSQAAQRAAAAGGGGAAPGAPGPPPLRCMQVVFSPRLPQSECFYVVEQSGVRGLRPEELLASQERQQQLEAAAAAQAAGPQQPPLQPQQQEWQWQQPLQLQWQHQQQPPQLQWQQQQQPPPQQQLQWQHQQQPPPPPQQQAPRLTPQQSIRQHFLRQPPGEPSNTSFPPPVPPQQHHAEQWQERQGSRQQQQRQEMGGRRPQALQERQAHWQPQLLQQQQQPLGWPLGGCHFQQQQQQLALP